MTVRTNNRSRGVVALNSEELKEKYNLFLESLQEKGVPKPEVIVPATILLILLGAGFLLTQQGFLAPETKELSLTVYSQEGGTIRNAAILLQNEDGEEWNEVTDNYGRADFKEINYETIKVSVDAAGYQAYRKQPLGNNKIYLESLTPPSKDVIVRVRDTTGHDVEGAQVLLLFDGGDTKAGHTNAFGESEIEVTTETDSSGTIQATADGFKSNQKTIYKYEWDTPIIIELTRIVEEQQEKSVSIYALVEDAQGNALNGITVSLTDANTNAAQRQGRTDSSGVSEFADLTVGWKFNVNAFDPEAKYAAYASTTSFTVQKDGSPIKIRLDKKEADAGELRFSAINEDSEVLANTKIMVFEELSGVLLAEATTDNDGKTIIAVAKNKAFYVTAYKPGYLPIQNHVQSGDTTKFILKKAIAGSFNTLTVHTKDAITNEPTPNALITLFKEDGFQLGYPAKRSDADGTTSFTIPTTLKGSSDYRVIAAGSLDYKEGRSDATTSFDGAELFIILKPIPGKIKATAIDASTNKPIKEATISLWNGEEALIECNTNPCELLAPPETELYLKAKSKEYLEATTVNKIVAPGEITEVEIRMYPSELAASLSTSFQGLYYEGEKVSELTNAEKFTARLLFNVPSNELSGATLFIKIGDSAHAGEEPITITAINVPQATIDSGAYYSEDCSETMIIEEGENEEEITPGDSRYSNWARIKLPDGFTGTTEIELELLVSPNAKAGDETKIYYNAYAEKNGVPLMSPLDKILVNELLDKKTLADSDYCYAKKRSEKLIVGNNVLTCRDSSCTSTWFEYDEGTYKKDFEVEAGQQFQFAFKVLALTQPIDSISIDYPDELIISNANGFSNDKLSLNLPIGEKQTKKVTFTATRALSLAEIKLSVHYDDPSAQPTIFTTPLKITGTNRFKIITSPETLVAGLSERIQITLLDQFSRPIPDAWITYYDCEDYPLNGQEIDVVGDDSRNNGANGKYLTQINPSTLGRIGIRIQRENFKTYESCDLEVLAGDYILLEPEVIEFTGTSTNLGQPITLTSMLPIESRISTSVRCYKGFEEIEQLVYVSPQSFKLLDESTVNLIVKENATAKAECYVTFKGRVNARSKTETTLFVRLDVQGPPAPLCPYPYQCLTESTAINRGCQPVTAYGCANGLPGTTTQTCFACEIGPNTLPNSIELIVSNTKPTDTQTYLISLLEAPLQCTVEGFEFIPTQTSPQQQNNYFNYQPNNWQMPSMQQMNVDYSMQGYYQNIGSMYGGYNNGMPGYGASAGLGASFSMNLPPYCPPTINMQNTYSNYQYSMNDYSYGASPANCQYPAICQNQGQMCPPNPSIPYACQYPAVCMNPSGCQYNQAPQPTTQSSRPPVEVSAIACTANELEVTARYTGADYYDNAGMGGQQQGFISIKLGPGESHRIQVTVIIEEPPLLQGQQQPLPFTPMIPPECFAGVINPLMEGNEGLDEYGLPEEIDLLFNPHTGKAHYERELNVQGNVLHKWSEKIKGVKVSISSNHIELEYDEDDFEEKDGELEVWLAGYQMQPKKIPVNLMEDDFTPSIIQLLVTDENNVEATYDSGEEEMECDDNAGSTKIKCKDGIITAKATKYSSSKKYHLEVTNIGDYQIREIPVRLAYTNDLKTGKEDEYDYSVEAGSTITFSKSDWLAAPDCGDLAKNEDDCTTTKIVVRSDADERIYPWSPDDEREDDLTVFVTGGQGECNELYDGVWEKNGAYYSDENCLTKTSEATVRTFLGGQGLDSDAINKVLAPPEETPPTIEDDEDIIAKTRISVVGRGYAGSHIYDEGEEILLKDGLNNRWFTVKTTQEFNDATLTVYLEKDGEKTSIGSTNLNGDETNVRTDLTGKEGDYLVYFEIKYQTEEGGKTYGKYWTGNSNNAAIISIRDEQQAETQKEPRIWFECNAGFRGQVGLIIRLYWDLRELNENEIEALRTNMVTLDFGSAGTEYECLGDPDDFSGTTDVADRVFDDFLVQLNQEKYCSASETDTMYEQVEKLGEDLMDCYKGGGIKLTLNAPFLEPYLQENTVNCYCYGPACEYLPKTNERTRDENAWNLPSCD